MAKEVIECIRQGRTESPEYTLDESLTVAQTVDSVLRALGVTFGKSRRQEIERATSHPEDPRSLVEIEPSTVVADTTTTTTTTTSRKNNNKSPNEESLRAESSKRRCPFLG